MNFTYSDYVNLIKLLKQNEYSICKYHEYENFYKFNNCKIAILRHDVDISLYDALKFAEIENRNNVNSTYFILLSTDFYNVFSKKNKVIINEISNMGHSIGLHFDETKYNMDEYNNIIKYVKYELSVLSNELGFLVDTFSMHRPSEIIKNGDLNIENCINTYSKEFFVNFKYVSDSRMFWREDPNDVIKSGNYDKLHILTHAFWYKDRQYSAYQIIKAYVDTCLRLKYDMFDENIREFDKFIDYRRIF